MDTGAWWAMVHGVRHDLSTKQQQQTRHSHSNATLGDWVVAWNQGAFLQLSPLEFFEPSQRAVWRLREIDCILETSSLNTTASSLKVKQKPYLIPIPPLPLIFKMNPRQLILSSDPWLFLPSELCSLLNQNLLLLYFLWRPKQSRLWSGWNEWISLQVMLGRQLFYFVALYCRVELHRSIPLGFPGGSYGKESTCNAGDPGLIPGLGRSPGEGNGNPLQYFCLENPMDRGAWWATVHGVTNGQTQLSN